MRPSNIPPHRPCSRKTSLKPSADPCRTSHAGETSPRDSLETVVCQGHSPGVIDNEFVEVPFSETCISPPPDAASLALSFAFAPGSMTTFPPPSPSSVFKLTSSSSSFTSFFTLAIGSNFAFFVTGAEVVEGGGAPAFPSAFRFRFSLLRSRADNPA